MDYFLSQRKKKELGDVVSPNSLVFRIRIGISRDA